MATVATYLNFLAILKIIDYVCAYIFRLVLAILYHIGSDCDNIFQLVLAV